MNAIIENVEQSTHSDPPSETPSDAHGELAAVLDGVRTHWQPYPIEAWQAGGVSGQLLGSVVRSPQLGNERTVLLYLPASYDSGDRRYPVIYLQDGQNMFDPRTAFGGQTWHVGETMTRLANEGIEAIVVAAYHTEKQRICDVEFRTLMNPGETYGYGEGETGLTIICDSRPTFAGSAGNATWFGPFVDVRFTGAKYNLLAVPEPSSLLGLGLALAFPCLRWRRKGAQTS